LSRYRTHLVLRIHSRLRAKLPVVPFARPPARLFFKRARSIS
jgi:hypothetical protein